MLPRFSRHETKTRAEGNCASGCRFFASIKKRIRAAQVKAALAANTELVFHYWEIGRDILANQARQGWGAKVIDRLAADLQRDFPTLSGYSVRNLKYMRVHLHRYNNLLSLMRQKVVGLVLDRPTDN
jgi:predicted nuclease of restriction endonuclease-like (RecB) superfamily